MDVVMEIIEGAVYRRPGRSVFLRVSAKKSRRYCGMGAIARRVRRGCQLRDLRSRSLFLQPLDFANRGLVVIAARGGEAPRSGQGWRVRARPPCLPTPSGRKTAPDNRSGSSSLSSIKDGSAHWPRHPVYSARQTWGGGQFLQYRGFPARRSARRLDCPPDATRLRVFAPR